MGTVFKKNGKVRFQILSKDHRPAHCHVFAPGAHAKIRLRDGVCYWVDGFDLKTVKELEEMVRKNKVKLMKEWERCHGKED